MSKTEARPRPDFINLSLNTTAPSNAEVASANHQALYLDSNGVINLKTKAGAIDTVGRSKAVARTATADGSGTGTIATGVNRVVVTSDDANKIIVLHAPVVGCEVELFNGATGYELRTSDPATISLNNVAGAGVELAVAANTVIVAKCTSATSWIATKIDSVGAPAGGGTPD